MAEVIRTLNAGSSIKFAAYNVEEGALTSPAARLADIDSKTLAAAAALVGDVADDVLARQVFGQGAAIDLALAPNGRLGRRFPGLAFRLRLAGGDRLLDVFQHEGELIGIDLFRKAGRSDGAEAP
jgi:hypothetical protein